MFNIVLVEPEIPQNTGNIVRTCACTGSRLHLIKPLGFDISESQVKRAGLDYWDKVDISVYENYAEFAQMHKGDVCYYLSKKAQKIHTQVKFEDNCYLVFGKETKGLDEKLLKDHAEHALRIPMNEGIRCLNLSNSVAVVVYEALRQNGYFGMK